MLPPYLGKKMAVAARIQTELNVPSNALKDNILTNSDRDITWLEMFKSKELAGDIAIIAGAPSMKGKIDEIKEFQNEGGKLLAVNGAHDFLVSEDVIPEYFAALDARSCNDFVNKPQLGCTYLLASQTHPVMFDKLSDYNVVLWHCEHDEFPTSELKEICKSRGIENWASIGARKTVGLTAIFLSYAMGFKNVYLYGLDSSFGDYQHSYKQEQNEADDLVAATVGVEEFKTTPALANQAQLYGHVKGLVEMAGVKLHMRSEGLIKAMDEARENMSLEQREAVKYLDMWDVKDYRSYSPGLEAAPLALHIMAPEKGSSFIDFGVGSGKAAKALQMAGFKVLGVDIAANCLDSGNFIPLCICPLWAIPENVKADYGYCTDVMEHIPTSKVEDVLSNISRCVEKKTFFQIDLVNDSFGQVIGDVLHLTVKPADWWLQKLEKFFKVEESEVRGDSLIVLTTNQTMETEKW